MLRGSPRSKRSGKAAASARSPRIGARARRRGRLRGGRRIAQMSARAARTGRSPAVRGHEVGRTHPCATITPIWSAARSASRRIRSGPLCSAKCTRGRSISSRRPHHPASGFRDAARGGRPPTAPRSSGCAGAAACPGRARRSSTISSRSSGARCAGSSTPNTRPTPSTPRRAPAGCRSIPSPAASSSRGCWWRRCASTCCRCRISSMSASNRSTRSASASRAWPVARRSRRRTSDRMPTASPAFACSERTSRRPGPARSCSG